MAPITAEGGAVAIVRISGPDSWKIAARIFNPWPEAPVPRMAIYGRFSTGDDGFCLPFEEGHSYTGEQSVELSGHGSRACVAALMEACMEAGARLARPGEFTERAFLNGRIDLTQAEGVREAVEAQTQVQFRQSNLLREGVLRETVRRVADRVVGVLAAVEASVDFSEEVGELDKPAARQELAQALEETGTLLATASAGRLLRKGVRIALVGPPNAGKSSLLNRLLGFDRSIVTEIPGTTRDFVEERIDLAGIPCVITDTAGLRESDEAIERIGIDRSRRVAEAADEIWFVYDAAVGWKIDDAELASSLGRPVRVLANKSDLAHPSLPDHLAVSAVTGEGIPELIESFARKLAGFDASAVWINDRHEPLLRSASEHVEAAQSVLEQDLPTDLASVHLQAALQDLGQVTGETASADILEQVFSKFCIGK